ncbi:MAG: hypothetical protein U0350_28820 [Caldilineaceae bacterium]
MATTLIEYVFKAMYDKHLFKQEDKYSLASMLGGKPFPISDLTGFDLKTPLAGGCPEGSPVGNATLDLTNITFAGLKGFTGKHYKTTTQADYTQFEVAINLTGSRVPAHPADFSKGKVFMEPSGKQVTNTEEGSPITGPLSLAGITDFPGLIIKGNFTAHQGCSAGGAVNPSGKFIATVDTLALSLLFKLYIPADLKQPVSIVIPNFTVDPVSAEQITVTLLRSDGSLPDYNEDNLTEYEAINFWFAQNAINFPPQGTPALHTQIAEMIKTYLAPEGPLNTAIKGEIETNANQFLKEHL